MKRICLIMTDAFSYNILSEQHLKELSKTGLCKVTCIHGGNSDWVKKLAELDNVTFLNIGLVRPPSFFADVLSLFKLLLHFIINRYDQVVFSTPKAMLLGSIASYLTLQRERICLVRGRAYENYFGLKRKFYVALDKVTFLLSNKVVFIAESLRQAYLKDIPNVKGIVVLNGSSKGVNTEKFCPLDKLKRELYREELGFKKGDFLICSVGRLCKDKGAVELQEIIKRLSIANSKIKFLIVGKVEDDNGLELRKLCEINPCCVYLPHTNSVASIFAISNIHLFLSYREGFGNVAIEAASCNVPTFSFDSVGVLDSVKHNVSGMHYSKNKIDELENDLIFYSNNIDKLNEDFKDARSWVIENFDYIKVENAYLKEFYNLDLKK